MWLFEGLSVILVNIFSFLPLLFLCGTIADKLGFMYEEHLCVLALTGSERVAQTHPLASYFLV